MIGMFDVGERVVYPAHGVGRIEAIEEKTVAGKSIQCYIITIIEKELTMIVPVDNADKVGLRYLISEEEIQEVLDILKQSTDDMPSRWKERDRFNHEKIRTGSLYEIAEVYRDLSHLEKEKTLSSGDRKMLENTRALIVNEIAHSKHIRFAQAELLVEEYCSAHTAY